MYPDFLVVGAQKAGTTWLYRSLRTHPQVWMPRRERATLLRREDPARWRILVQASRRPSCRLALAPAGKISPQTPPEGVDLAGGRLGPWVFLRKPNDGWYASLFDPGKGQIAGETTPDYSVLGKRMISHVHDIMPETKIVLMMRNPIERPWSVVDMGRRIKGQSPKTPPRRSNLPSLRTGG